MSGKNTILKPGDVLFRVGDQSDGMYLVRSGQIIVYLEKNGLEIALATVGPGSMLGEMALFDKKPRSASARAINEAEVTKITNDEFSKILTQIPKWFVSLMSTLSSRLRDTNQRLQDLESKSKGDLNPIEEVIKTLNILQLLWYKMGVKEDKNWSLEREPAEIEVAHILNKERAKINSAVEAIIQGNLITAGKNTYKKDVLLIHNRGDLERFIDFSVKIRKKFPTMKVLPQEFVDIIEQLTQSSKTAPYDNVSLDFKSIEEAGRKKGLAVETWIKIMPMLADLDEAIVISKTGKDMSAKVQKKLVESVYLNAKILRAISCPPEKKATGKVA